MNPREIVLQTKEGIANTNNGRDKTGFPSFQRRIAASSVDALRANSFICL